MIFIVLHLKAFSHRKFYATLFLACGLILGRLNWSVEQSIDFMLIMVLNVHDSLHSLSPILVRGRVLLGLRPLHALFNVLELVGLIVVMLQIHYSSGHFSLLQSDCPCVLTPFWS